MSEPIYCYPGADNPQAYEYLNLCTDPEQRVENLMWSIVSWHGRVVLDLGAGSGFHVARFFEKAKRIVAVEPDPKLRQQMQSRFRHRSADKISIIAGSAESIPLRDRSIDIVHARFAYFFGTDACLAGLSEVKRVMKPGSHFFIVDVIPEYGEWGKITRAAYPEIFTSDYHAKHASFYTGQGFTTYRVNTVFRALNRDVMKRVFEMDFPHKVEELMESVDTLELGYGLAVYHLNRV